MINASVILFGKFVSYVAKRINLGNGSTWPGHIALRLNKNIIKDIISKSNLNVIVVAGTNGKTTTAKLITTILINNGKRVIYNSSGANLLNGIASTLLLNSNYSSKLKTDYAIFETDENALPLILDEIKPDYIIILNLFRDQLDRYGELNIIIDKWKKAVNKLPKKATILLNADDPQVANLVENDNLKKFYFSCKTTSLSGKLSLTEHAADSAHCPNCGTKLNYTSVTFSHLGRWYCKKCKLKRPDKAFNASEYYPLSGLYNEYNTNAAVLFATNEGFINENIIKALKKFKPAFGRQEIIQIGEKKVNILLSKNPTGFNESLKTVKKLGAKNILFVLNDRIPDGTDISWIWDTDIEGILNFNENIVISGDRAYEMGLRIKYAIPSKYQVSSIRHQVETNLQKAISIGLGSIKKNETLYIIPTYTAMLEVRKILTGKKIL